MLGSNMSYIASTAAGLNYEYFCPFCLKVTKWHGSADGGVGDVGSGQNGEPAKNQNVSQCTECGVVGSNQGRDCPNIFGVHLKDGGVVQRECSSKNTYLFCVDKCRPKLAGVAPDQVGQVAFDDRDTSERAKLFQCYTCCFDLMTLPHQGPRQSPEQSRTEQKIPPFRYVFQALSAPTSKPKEHDMSYCTLCMQKSPWVAYTHKALEVDTTTGQLTFEASAEDFEDIGMDEQVIHKCLGTPKQQTANEEEEAEDCCQAYRIIKKEGIDCGTCHKIVKEIWFRTDDDAKCGECFEQREIDRMMLSQIQRQVREAKRKQDATDEQIRRR